MNENGQATAALVTALVDVQTTDGSPIRWSFPVVPGTPLAQVREEISARFATDPNLDLTNLRIAYPSGTWNQPLDRDIPVLGSRTEAPTTPEPRHPTPSPAPSTKKQRPVEHSMGALPDSQTRPPLESAVADLDQMLDEWSAEYRLSSAEYYLMLSRALSAHAMRLVSMDRRTPNRRG